MSVRVLTESMGFTMNVKEGLISKYGKPLLIVLIAYQLLQLLTKKYSVAMVEYLQIYNQWNKYVVS